MQGVMKLWMRVGLGLVESFWSCQHNQSWFQVLSETMTMFCSFQLQRVLKWGLLLDGRRVLTNNGHSPSAGEAIRWLSQSYLTTDGQSASLFWCQATIRTRDQFFIILEIFFRQLRICYFVASSLTRGQVCNLLLLSGLGSESRGTQNHILLSQFFRLPQLWMPCPHI
jgi:hypothetical protein